MTLYIHPLHFPIIFSERLLILITYDLSYEARYRYIVIRCCRRKQFIYTCTLFYFIRNFFKIVPLLWNILDYPRICNLIKFFYCTVAPYLYRTGYIFFLRIIIFIICVLIICIIAFFILILTIFDFLYFPLYDYWTLRLYDYYVHPAPFCKPPLVLPPI